MSEHYHQFAQIFGIEEPSLVEDSAALILSHLLNSKSWDLLPLSRTMDPLTDGQLGKLKRVVQALALTASEEPVSFNDLRGWNEMSHGECRILPWDRLSTEIQKLLREGDERYIVLWRGDPNEEWRFQKVAVSALGDGIDDCATKIQLPGGFLCWIVRT